MILVTRGHVHLAKQGYLLVAKRKTKTPDGETKTETTRIPLIDLELLVVTGTRASITTGLLLALSKAGIPVLVHGREAEAIIHNPYQQANPEARIAQADAARTQTGLEIAKQLIHAKIRGLAELIAALKTRDDAKPLLEKQRQPLAAKTRQQLLTIEAELTRKAWTILRETIPSSYGFTARNPRARDPINSAINYTYAILYTLATHALVAAGLDPHIGLLHTIKPGSKSLTYDYTEQFKPLAVHAVIQAANKHNIETDPQGLLTPESLETVTKTLYKLLKRKPTNHKHTNKAYIYIKAWQLKNTLTKHTKYQPYIYKPK